MYKFKNKDVVVSLKDQTTESLLNPVKAGDMKRMTSSGSCGPSRVWFESDGKGTYCVNDWRLATEEEALEFKHRPDVTNISQINTVESMDKFEFKVDDIVVVLDTKSGAARIGEIYKILSITDNKWALGDCHGGAHYLTSIRHATQDEIEAYNIGIKNINNIVKVEKEDALIVEAKKRYPVGIRFYPAHLSEHSSDNKHFCVITDNTIFSINGGTIYAMVDGLAFSLKAEYGNCSWSRIVYQDGRWAKIISSPDIIKEDLLEKAKRDYPKGIKFNNSKIIGIDLKDVVIDKEYYFYDKNGDVMVSMLSGSSYTLCRDGRWADIINIEIKKKEMENLTETGMSQGLEKSLLKQAIENYPLGTKFIMSGLEGDLGINYCVITDDTVITKRCDGVIYAKVPSDLSPDGMWTSKFNNTYGNTNADRILYKDGVWAKKLSDEVFLKESVKSSTDYISYIKPSETKAKKEQAFDEPVIMSKKKESKFKLIIINQ